MKTKKVLVYMIVCAFTLGLLSSCAIDKKCPAYSKVSAENLNIPS